MISAVFYPLIYYSIVTILTLYCIFTYRQYTYDNNLFINTKSGNFVALLLIIGYIIFIGFRPLAWQFIDMLNYNETFLFISENVPYYDFTTDTPNLIFDNLFDYLASNSYDIVILFVIMASIYFGCMYGSIKKIFPHDTLYALLIYLGAFSTYSYAVNGIKAGAAASIFLLAFAFYRKPIIAALFCLISLGFHHSMTLPIFAFALAYIVRNPKYFFFGWFICLFISSFQIPGVTDFLAQFADDQSVERYLSSEGDLWEGKTGFRWDFILYSLPPILISIWTLYYYHIKDRLYKILLCTYLAVNGIWMLCMYVPFNNRIAYLSWFILPILIAYPFFKFKLYSRQYLTLNYIVGIYLAFTLFSAFLYK